MANYSLKTNLALLFFFLLLACSKKVVYPTYFEGKNTTEHLPILNDSTLAISIIAPANNYGRTESNPIFLGVKDVNESGDNRVKFLNALAGPNGEELSFKRYKSCCPFRTLNSRTVGADQKFGLLDIWVITYDGISNPDTLYVNAYDQGELIAPKGYTIK